MAQAEADRHEIQPERHRRARLRDGRRTPPTAGGPEPIQFLFAKRPAVALWPWVRHGSRCRDLLALRIEGTLSRREIEPDPDTSGGQERTALANGDVAQTLVSAASALMPTLAGGAMSQPRASVETSLDTAGTSACATPAGRSVSNARYRRRRATSALSTGTPRLTLIRSSAVKGTSPPTWRLTPRSRSRMRSGSQTNSTAPCVPKVVVPASMRMRPLVGPGANSTTADRKSTRLNS